MNKRFEAVPISEWRKKNPHAESYLLPTAYIDLELHVLLPIEEQWVNIQDRLPEPNQSVLLWMVHQNDRLSGYIHWTWEKESTSNITISGRKVTHWQPDFEPPLPTSPKDTEQLKPLDK